MKTNIAKIEKKTSALANRLTKVDFAVKYSPSNCIKLYKDVSTVKSALESNSGSLAQIRKEYDEQFQQTHVMLFLADLQEKLGVKNKMSQSALEECADFIISDYYYFTLADINLIFTRAKKGVYGKFYESISMPKILEWFAEYSEERAEQAFTLNLNKDKQVKVVRNEAQVKYAKTLYEAQQTGNYSEVDKMLKERKDSSLEDFEAEKRKLERKVESHTDFIFRLETMKMQETDTLIIGRYNADLIIAKAQKVATEKKLSLHLNKYNLKITKNTKVEKLKLISKALDLIEADGKEKGVVDCPKCKAGLHYTRTANGNVLATCEVVDCFTFLM